MLRMLGLGSRGLPAETKLKLPQVNSFVDLTMTAGGPRGAVCLEAMSDRTLTVGALPGTRPGETGVFSYSNAVGRFRFSARCTEVGEGVALFAMPERIETLQVFADSAQRNAMRIEATLPAHWRFAPGNRGSGDYTRASVTDLSRSGASLVVDREIAAGSTLELRVALSSGVPAIVLLGEVVRNSPVETTKKISLGVRFHGVTPAADRAIMDFINRRQAERRNRGLA